MVSSDPSFMPLAINGMDAAWAGCDGLAAFERMIYTAGQQFTRPDQVVPPAASVDQLNKVARRALLDAGFDIERPLSERIAALVACHATISVSWPWASQVVDLSDDLNPLASALEVAQRLFSQDQADVILFAAASGFDRFGLADNVFALETTGAMGFDRSVHGWRLGDGAGALVLSPHRPDESQGRKIYAVITASASGVGKQNAMALPTPPTLDDVRVCCKTALAMASLQPGDIGYVETFASGSDALDGIEIAGLAQAYRQPEQDLTTAFGSVQSNAGYLGAAAGLAGLIRTALCVYHRMIPAVPGWSAPKLPALWKGSPFYAPTESRAWFSPVKSAGRVAGLNVVGRGGSFAHVLLAEHDRDALHPNHALDQGGFYFIPLAANDLPDLLDLLKELRGALVFSPNLLSLASEWNQASNAHPQAPLAAAILGHDHEELIREVDLALKAIPEAFEKRGEWQTPLGSYFTADPAGLLGEVALVYPGAFNSYPWAVKDLFHLFPWLHLKSIGRTQDLGRVIRERLLYPRSLAAPDKDEQTRQEGRLLSDACAMLTSGTTAAILFTYILEEGFKIPTRAAFGYSLGENSMLFASGVWQEGDAVTDRLEGSDTFHHRLAGPQNAIRGAWGLPYADTSDPQAPLWANYLVMASNEKVEEAIQAEGPAPRVYVTHINTPRQVVIGGDPAACQRVIKALRCASLQAPFDYALHCAPMASEYNELLEMHDWEVARAPHLRLYTAAGYEPMPLDRKIIAERIARMLCSPLDFPRLIRRVYDDGARVFIEAGAGSNCARWIDETLKGSPHLALSINRRGTDDYTNLVRTLARLYSHRVPMDLSALYAPVYESVKL